MERLPKEYKSYINRLVEVFRAAVWAGEYRLNVHHTDNVKIDYDLADDDVVRAAVTIDPAYLNVNLTISESVYNDWKAGNYEPIAETLCHEFCHILVCPLQALARIDIPPSREREVREVVERQTQRITNAIFPLVPQEKWMPEKGEIYRAKGVRARASKNRPE